MRGFKKFFGGGGKAEETKSPSNRPVRAASQSGEAAPFRSAAVPPTPAPSGDIFSGLNLKATEEPVGDHDTAPGDGFGFVGLSVRSPPDDHSAASDGGFNLPSGGTDPTDDGVAGPAPSGGFSFIAGGEPPMDGDAGGSGGFAFMAQPLGGDTDGAEATGFGGGGFHLPSGPADDTDSTFFNGDATGDGDLHHRASRDRGFDLGGGPASGGGFSFVNGGDVPRDEAGPGSSGSATTPLGVADDTDDVTPGSGRGSDVLRVSPYASPEGTREVAPVSDVPVARASVDDLSAPVPSSESDVLTFTRASRSFGSHDMLPLHASGPMRALPPTPSSPVRPASVASGSTALAATRGRKKKFTAKRPGFGREDDAAMSAGEASLHASLDDEGSAAAGPPPVDRPVSPRRGGRRETLDSISDGGEPTGRVVGVESASSAVGGGLSSSGRRSPEEMRRRDESARARVVVAEVVRSTTRPVRDEGVEDEIPTERREREKTADKDGVDKEPSPSPGSSRGPCDLTRELAGGGVAGEEEEPADADSPRRERAGGSGDEADDTSSSGWTTDGSGLRRRRQSAGAEASGALVELLEAEAAAKEEDLETRLQNVVRLMEGRVATVALRKNAVHAKARTLQAQRVRTWDELVELQRKAKSTELAQSDASAREDYETAERLDQTLVDVEARMAALESDAEAFSAELAATEEEERELLQHEAEARASALLSLHELRAQEERRLAEGTRSAEQRICLAEERIRVEELEVSRASSHLELDAKLAAESEAAVEARISELSVDVRREQDTLISRREEIRDEMALLRERLRVLEGEEAACSLALEEKEGQVEGIRARFRIDLERVGTQRRRIEAEAALHAERTANMADELSLLTAERLALQDMQEQARGVLTQIDASVATAEHAGESVTARERELNERAHRRSDLAEWLAGERDQLSSAREAAKVVSQRVALVGLTVSRLTREVAEVRQAIDEMDARVPVLEADKKLAAASRQFKEAAKLAADLKSLGSERELRAARLEATERLLQEDGANLKGLKDKLLELNADLVKQERQADMRKLERLRALLREFKGRLRRITDRKTEEAAVLVAERAVLSARVARLCVAHELAYDPHEGSDDEGGVTMAMAPPPAIPDPTSPTPLSPRPSDVPLPPRESEARVVDDAPTVPHEAAAEPVPAVEEAVDEEHLEAEVAALEGELVDLESKVDALAAEELYDQCAAIQELIDSKHARLTRLRSHACAPVAGLGVPAEAHEHPASTVDGSSAEAGSSVRMVERSSAASDAEASNNALPAEEASTGGVVAEDSDRVAPPHEADLP